VRRGLGGLARLWRDQGGVVALEFALILPVLVALLTGAAELGRLLLLTQKLQNGAFVLADLVGRDETISVGTLDDIFLAVETMMEPFDFGANGVAIVTSVGGTEKSGPRVNWQRAGGGELNAASGVGIVDGPAALPAVLSLADKETLIVTEVHFDFEPLFGLMFDPVTIRRVAYHKPRLGVLDTLQP
jgi:Flp pilus assembly pilin Flp